MDTISYSAVDNQYPELQLKIASPRVARSLVTREHLSCLGPALAHYQIILVQGSAGYGKTTLLTQWRTELLRTGAVVLWLSCDELDTNTRALLCVAMGLAEATGDQAFVHAVDETAFLPSLTRILALIRRYGQEVAIMLDNVHRWPSATVHNALNHLLEHAPANLRLMLSARPHAGLNWRDLLADGRYIEIDQANLKFRPEDVLEIMQSRLAGASGIESAVKLHQLTDGWPLGIQLACASIALAPGAEHSLLDRGEPAGSLEQYFVAHLADKFPKEQVSFLATLSLIERFNGELAAELTGRPDATALLQALAASTPVLEWNTNDGEWFTIHALARRFLLHTHFRRTPALRKEIQIRAAHWYAAHGYFEEAVHLAELCARADLVQQWIEQALTQFADRGDIKSLLYWKDRLSLETRHIKPAVLFAVAQALAFSAKSGLVRQWMHQDYPWIAQEGANDYARAVLDLCVDITSGRFAAAQAVLNTLDLDHPATEDLRARHFARGAQFYLATHSGQSVDMTSLHQSAADFPLDSAESRLNRFLQAWSLLWTGQLDALIAVLTSLQLSTELDRGRHDTSASTLAVMLAAGLWQQGQRAKADLLLANRIDSLETWAPPPTLVEAFLIYIRSAASDGEFARAEYLAGRLYDLGRDRDWSRAMVFAVRELAWLTLRQGKRNQCRAILSRFEADIPADLMSEAGALAPLLQLQRALAQGYVGLAEAQWEAASTAAQTAITVAQGINRPYDELAAQCILAQCLVQTGYDYSPVTHRVIELVAAGGFSIATVALSELFLTEKAPAVATEQAPSLVTARDVVRPSPLLTPKERDIVHFLLQGFSNKQIANALTCSEQTVKWHLKNIFAKLHAGSRRHVVERARVLGIIESL